MKKICLPIVLFLLALYCPAQNITIGAWNIQWLGTPENRSACGKNVRQTAHDLAVYVAQSRVDVLALSEISDTNGAGAPYANGTLDLVFARLNDSGANEWKYLLFPKRSPNEQTQLVGIAWNEKTVRKVGDPYRIPMSIPNNVSAWDRWATAIKFSFGSNKTDIVVIPVHMKANYQGNYSVQRDREISYLMPMMDDVRTHFNDRDIVIVGDTNILNKDEPAVTRFVSGGFIDLNNNDRPTTTEGAAPFDRAFLPQGQSEFSVSQEDVFKWSEISKEEHRVRLSDHYMIRFLVKIMNDDD